VDATLAQWRQPASTGRPASLSYVLYTLLDAVVDSYFAVLDRFETDLDAFEEALFRNAPPTSAARLFSVRRELLWFRRVVGPERDVVNQMLRHDSPVANRDDLVFYQDLYDHLLRITDSIDLYRDMVAGALDGYLSVQSNTLNVTVQRLTSWSIILMSMGLFFAFWGMNFVDMPELQLPLGGVGALLLAAGTGTVLFIYFRRRRWI
jgi:magnesium transporter